MFFNYFLTFLNVILPFIIFTQVLYIKLPIEVVQFESLLAIFGILYATCDHSFNFFVSKVTNEKKFHISLKNSVIIRAILCILFIGVIFLFDDMLDLHISNLFVAACFLNIVFDPCILWNHQRKIHMAVFISVFRWLCLGTLIFFFPQLHLIDAFTISLMTCVLVACVLEPKFCLLAIISIHSFMLIKRTKLLKWWRLYLNRMKLYILSNLLTVLLIRGDILIISFLWSDDVEKLIFYVTFRKFFNAYIALLGFFTRRIFFEIKKEYSWFWLMFEKLMFLVIAPAATVYLTLFTTIEVDMMVLLCAFLSTITLWFAQEKIRIQYGYYYQNQLFGKDLTATMTEIAVTLILFNIAYFVGYIELAVVIRFASGFIYWFLHGLIFVKNADA